MNITHDIRFIGVNDRTIDLFEGQYPVPHGMSYNSYVLLDGKVAVMDTVDAHFTEEWLDRLQEVLGERQPDYLIVQHMEPDHSAGIAQFMERYPQAVVVASDKAFRMMRQFFGTDFADRRIVVGEGDTLPLGTHTLQFLTAPMVHWPEVLVTYDRTDRVLFSADAFGKFGTWDTEEDWACEARRYYIGIVGKYGVQVQALLKKAAALDIDILCPLHGPVLTAPLTPYLSLYQTWSSYTPESEGVVIAYASVYGHTRAAAEQLAQQLRADGTQTVLYDLTRCDLSEAVEDAFRYGKLVLASATYNADIFPCMHDFLHRLTERSFQNRTVALIENGSWAPTAAKAMRSLLEGCKNLTWADTVVTVRSALDDTSRSALEALARELR